ncbi:TPA_exp: Uncharacterized protein A8136_2745 [Trichophyton benhamiae CBS 112371]|uniref:Uncharacterized protein n=1 Tax=Arthroderma benhamiae (strain ATCC MYA-4681 / CBS 112371) TaxID=663331 RepID=D4AL89_ARTBC|nr:uncharacterized protein ARB_05086 [Trichophyton benhamiae CBS 112371]EFE36148.1 hypothetical protein ARB_05086 [Trichophyton benhamiae CBS 112371]DAA78960.1 TPA_exp: Uncharacterized protein A8136_2745 [Trichophyton benhamiae CBS 112371]
MPPLKLSSVTFVLFLIPFTIGAGDTDLIGCNSVGCPTIDGYDRCTVEDATHIGVGLSRIQNAPSALEGFSLVKGVNVSNKANEDPGLPFNSLYYLSVPETADTGKLRGCTVVFNDPPFKKFKYPMKEGKIAGTSVIVNMTDSRAAAGMCSDVIEQSCIDKILQNASDVAEEGSGNTCEKLEREMKKNFDGCTSFGGPGTSLGNFTVKSLDALSTVKNSSDCWPTKQKSDQLLEIARATSYGNETDTYEEYTNEAYKITPVLTLFVGGNGSLIDHTSSQMTCLKVITMQKYDVEPGHPENRAITLRGSWVSLVIVGLTAIFMAL